MPVLVKTGATARSSTVVRLRSESLSASIRALSIPSGRPNANDGVGAWNHRQISLNGGRPGRRFVRFLGGASGVGASDPDASSAAVDDSPVRKP